MAVKIGSARINETQTTSGGKAGDQTGKEVCTQNWYLHSKGWVVIRPKNSTVAEKIAANMQAACDNDLIGYSQWRRGTLYNEVLQYSYDCSKVTTACECDCSSLVRVCCLYAGITVKDFSTANERKSLEDTGKFEIKSESKYTTSSDYLLRGDILVTKIQGHTAVVLSNGSKAKGSTSSSSTSSSLSTSVTDSSTQESNSTSSDTKEITSVVVKSITGSGGAYKFSGLRSILTDDNSGVELLIQNDRIYAPVVVGTLNLTRERNSPAVLTFEVVKDDVLNFQEGNPVRLKVNGKKVFYGYVFTKQRSDNSTIKVTCYDQMRYLKNKDTLSYSKKTYSQLLKMIAADYNLLCGTIDDTSYCIPSRIEDGTLLDILGNASDLTVIHTGNLFVLYDDFGELSLKNIHSMLSESLIYEDSAESFSYSSSIDDEVYNSIKLSYDNDTTGEREVYIAQDSETQKTWGVLQNYESVSNSTGEELAERAKLLLDYYNRKRRKLTINNCFGNTDVRGGTLVPVKLSLGDIELSNFMMVEKATHKFENGQHFMDLIVSERGEFVV